MECTVYENANAEGFFWEGLDRGQLLFQKCMVCDKLRYPPSVRCSNCGALDTLIVEVSGRGILYSYTILYRPPIARLVLPMTIGLVELAEGVRCLGALDRSIERPEIGMKLRAKFAKTDPGSVPLSFVADSENDE
jgi:uncharacterized protein